MANSFLSVLHMFFDNQRQVFRFFVVGIINTIFGFLVYSSFIYVSNSYFLSSAAAMVAGVAFNYRTIKSYVFNSGHKASIWAFVGCYFSVLVVTVLLLEALGSLGADPYLSGFLVSLPMAVVSYFLQKRFVFRKESDD